MNDHVVLEAFRGAIGNPSALTEPLEVVLRPDEHRVTVLEVAGSTRIVAPDELTARAVQHLLEKDVLFWDHAKDSAERVAGAADWRYRVADVLGPAHLLCAFHAPVVGRQFPALVGAEVGLAELSARTSPHDVAESGVRELDVMFGATEGDRIVAVAGWETWDGGMAKIGILVDEDRRHEGLGLALAAMTTTAALEAELLPLWRARSSNRASLAVADRLGYEPVGHQVTVVLARRT